MAVQAQYPSNVLILSRSEQERKEMEFPQPPSKFLDPSPAIFYGGGGCRSEQERKEMEFPQPPSKFLDPSPAIFYGGGRGNNTRKRARDPAPALVPQQQMQQQQLQHANNLISLQMQQQQQQQQQATTPAVIRLAQMQLPNQLPLPPPTAPMVSTGLCLDFDGRQFNKSSSASSSSIASSFFSNELAAQIAQQHEEIERLLHAHGEELRRGLAEKRRRHYRAVAGAAEEAAARRLREKEAEAECAARRGAELEERLARLRAESTAWQAKALADQAEAAALHAQLQRAAAAAAERPSGGGECSGGGDGAEDAESAHVDPDRAEPERACRSCRFRPASVVLLPCRHLCLCDSCDLSSSSCPLCLIGRTGSVHVFFS